MEQSMTVKVGSITFDRATYDKRGDVLYLHVGAPRPADDGEETPEGHVLRLDGDGHPIGLTIINAQALLDRDGAISVTIPERIALTRAELAPALV
jgi:uncharacterized protein YuzE